MAAMTKARRLREETWQYQAFELGNAKQAWKNGLAVYDQSAGKCIPAETGASQTDLFVLGFFAEDMLGNGTKKVSVRLKREITVRWMANDGANPVLVTDLGKDIYGVDDQTVSISSATSTRSVVGKAWAIDAVKGVAVEVI